MNEESQEINLSLANQKIQAEIEKLQAETKSVNRSWSKPSSWIPLAVAVATIGASISQYHTSSLKDRELALIAKEEKLSTELEIASVKKTLKQLEKDIRLKTNELSELAKSAGADESAVDTILSDVSLLSESAFERIHELSRDIPKFDDLTKTYSIVAKIDVESGNLIDTVNGEPVVVLDPAVREFLTNCVIVEEYVNCSFGWGSSSDESSASSKK